MEQVFLNGLFYSVEFIKVLLAMVYIWKAKTKKNISYAFVLSLAIVMIWSWFTDLSRISIIYEIIIVVVITLFTVGKHVLMLSVLTFILISLADMFFAEAAMSLFNIPHELRWNNSYLVLAYNMISLIFLVIYVLIFGRKQTKKPKVSGVLLPIYIIGALALSILVTGIQIVKMDAYNSIHHNIIYLSLGLAAVFLVGLCFFLERDRRENERLQYVNEMNSSLMEAQSSYYLALLHKDSETRAFRHDIKAQLLCMSMLYKNGEYEKLGEYIRETQEIISELSANVNTGNDYVNAILMDLANHYPDVKLEWKGIVPDLTLSYVDLCTLFYNLLKNAYEAAEGTLEKTITVTVKVMHQSMFILVSNYYTSVIKDDKGDFVTTKAFKEHGYGIGNIKRCVEKYHGEYSAAANDNMFKTEILLPGVVDK